jgi:hypothetical protein
MWNRQLLEARNGRGGEAIFIPEDVIRRSEESRIRYAGMRYTRSVKNKKTTVALFTLAGNFCPEKVSGKLFFSNLVLLAS